MFEQNGPKTANYGHFTRKLLKTATFGKVLLLASLILPLLVQYQHGQSNMSVCILVFNRKEAW